MTRKKQRSSPHLGRRTRYVLVDTQEVERRRRLAETLRAQLVKYPTLGSRWRFCAECGKPLLVNVGSADDSAEAVVCGLCSESLRQGFDGGFVISRSYGEIPNPTIDATTAVDPQNSMGD